MYKLKVRKIGNSLVLALPGRAARALRVQEGDEVHLIETLHGFRLTAYDHDFETTMLAAEAFMDRYRNALRDLAT